MSYMRRKDQAAIQATADRRRREDDAPRLHDEIPRLATLRLTFEDVRAEGRTDGTAYVRPIVVASAPALFEVRCTEPRCDGRYDLTLGILRALRQGLTKATGQENCDGMVAAAPCNRVLGYLLEATYRPE